MNNNLLKVFLEDSEDIGKLIYMTLLASEHIPQAQEHLTDLICFCLEQKHDQFLLDAIGYAHASNHQQKLKSIIANFTLFSEITKRPYKGEDAILFAIPIIFLTNKDHNIPDKLNNISLLVSLFRREHLLSDDTTLFLRSELYRYEDLDMKPSEHLKLMGECVSHFCFGKQNTAYFSKLAKFSSQTSSRCELRFLLCLTTSKNDDKPFCSENYSLNNYMEAISEWQDEMTVEISRQTGIEAIKIHDPRPLHHALSNGLRLLNTINIKIISSIAVRKAARHLSRCHALISMHSDQEETQSELRVSFFDDTPELIERCSLKLDDPEAHMDFYSEQIFKTLNENQVDSVENIQEVLPLDIQPNYQRIYIAQEKPTLH